MPRKKSSRRPKRRMRPRGIIETFTFSVQNGSSTEVLVSTLTSRPPRCNFRPIWFEIDVCGYQSGHTTTPGWLAPVAAQISFHDSTNLGYCSTSRLMLAGANPKKLRTYYPRSADWWPYNIVEKTAIADINAVCVGPLSDNSVKGYLRGIGRMMIIVQEETCVASCPAIGYVDDSPSTSTSGFEALENI